MVFRGVWLCWSWWPWHPGGMRSVYEAAGGSEGLLRLAEAWHRRVMADEMVSHAFSHGFHPQHSQRLGAYWAEALGGPASYSGSYGDETSVVRIHSAMARTRRWTAGRSPASTGPWAMWG
jgi:truncated hemoglobin YjbI